MIYVTSDFHPFALSRPYGQFHEMPGTVSDYAQGVQSFLSSQSHGVDFASRKLIGIGHSGGTIALYVYLVQIFRSFTQVLILTCRFHLPKLLPKLTFHAFVLLDTGIDMPLAEYSKLSVKYELTPGEVFRRAVFKRPHSWPSYQAARKELLKHPDYRRWDTRVLELFMVRMYRTGH